MPSFMKLRLMGMMFLQFFVSGLMVCNRGQLHEESRHDGCYLSRLPCQPHWFYSFAVFLGMIADRFFPVQKVMGVMHILSGLFVCAAPIARE